MYLIRSCHFPHYKVSFFVGVARGAMGARAPEVKKKMVQFIGISCKCTPCRARSHFLMLFLLGGGVGEFWRVGTLPIEDCLCVLLSVCISQNGRNDNRYMWRLIILHAQTS